MCVVVIQSDRLDVDGTIESNLEVLSKAPGAYIVVLAIFYMYQLTESYVYRYVAGIVMLERGSSHVVLLLLYSQFSKLKLLEG